MPRNGRRSVNSCLFSGQREWKACWGAGCDVGLPAVMLSVLGKGELLIGDAVCLHGGRGGSGASWMDTQNQETWQNNETCR